MNEDEPSGAPALDDLEAFRARLSQAGFDTVSARTRVDGTIAVLPPDVNADVDRLPVLTALDEGRAQLKVGAPFSAGGMGMICMGRQLPLMRDVAVKLVAEKREGSQSEARELLYEGRVMGMLEHPNIVPVYELGRDQRGDVLLVMKHVEGSPWASLLRGPQRGDELLRHLEILTHVCHAIEFAHSRSVLHRDLKPDNVMVGRFGEVYVLDWGLALSLDDTESSARGLPPAANVRQLAGTPGYMAPEMVLPEGNLDERTDGFLLGATLHHVVTGHPRWRGSNAVTRFHDNWVCGPPEYDDDVPAELRQILTRSMAREPGDRFDDVASFREAIEGFVRHEGARQLAREADARRAALRSLPPEPAADADAERLFTEARFGYQQALAAWPDSHEARVGLRDSSLLMLERALDHGAADIAARLVRELGDDVPKDARARAHALQAQRGRDAKELLRLRELEDQQNIGTGRAARGVLIAALGAAWCAGALATNAWIPPALQAWLLAGLAATSAMAVVGGHRLRQRADGTNEFDRFTSLDTAAHAFAAALGLAVCAWVGLPIFVGLAFGHLLLGLTQVTMSLAFDPRTWPGAVANFGAVAAVIVFREHALVASALAGGGALVFAGWFVRRLALLGRASTAGSA
jgi:serine/threonine-protein kinase